MNNNLLKKRYELNEELHKIIYCLKKLENLENTGNKFFSYSESIDALNKIHTFIENTKKRKEQLYNELNEIRKEIEHLCKHELLIKEENQHVCVLCGNYFNEDKINFEHIFLENINYESYEINEILKEIIFNDENFLDSFAEKIRQKNLKKVRIYRR